MRCASRKWCPNLSQNLAELEVSKSGTQPLGMNAECFARNIISLSFNASEEQRSVLPGQSSRHTHYCIDLSFYFTSSNLSRKKRQQGLEVCHLRNIVMLSRRRVRFSIPASANCSTQSPVYILDALLHVPVLPGKPIFVQFDIVQITPIIHGKTKSYRMNLSWPSSI